MECNITRITHESGRLQAADRVVLLVLSHDMFRKGLLKTLMDIEFFTSLQPFMCFFSCFYIADHLYRVITAYFTPLKSVTLREHGYDQFWVALYKCEGKVVWYCHYLTLFCCKGYGRLVMLLSSSCIIPYGYSLFLMNLCFFTVDGLVTSGRDGF